MKKHNYLWFQRKGECGDGRREVPSGVELCPDGRPAAGHPAACGGSGARRPVPDPAGRHRQRQDFYDGKRHRPVQPPHLGAGP